MFQKARRVESKSTLDDVASLPCCACGKTQGVVAHHIKHKGAGGGDEFHNLLPLCMDCHIEIHKGQILFAQKHKSVRNALRLRGWHIEMKYNQVLKLTKEE